MSAEGELATEPTGQLELTAHDLTAPGREKFVAWLATFGIDDPNSIYGICIDRGDGPTLTVHRFARNGEGRAYFHPGTHEIAMAEPLTVPLR